MPPKKRHFGILWITASFLLVSLLGIFSCASGTTESDSITYIGEGAHELADPGNSDSSPESPDLSPDPEDIYPGGDNHHDGEVHDQQDLLLGSNPCTDGLNGEVLPLEFTLTEVTGEVTNLTEEGPASGIEASIHSTIWLTFAVNIPDSPLASSFRGGIFEHKDSDDPEARVYNEEIFQWLETGVRFCLSAHNAHCVNLGSDGFYTFAPFLAYPEKNLIYCASAETRFPMLLFP